MEEDFPVIGGYRLDLKALMGITHHCDPMQCDNGLSCCSYYVAPGGPARGRLAPRGRQVCP